MDLNVNLPAYYTNIYGVDDEVYWMCRELSRVVKEKKYSELINIVGIVPIIAPKDEIDKGLWKEVKKCENNYGIATVSFQVDYAVYVNSDIEKKKSMIIQNVLKSIKAIAKKGKVDYEQFENDIKIFCNENNIII